MNLDLKQRLLGAVVIICIGIIVIPMLLNTPRPDPVTPIADPEVKQLTFTHQDIPEIADPIPESPEWETVVTENPEQRPKWFVQVGLFAHTDNANRLQSLMQTAGYRAETLERQNDDQQVNLVWVGPYYSQAEAEHALQGIKEKSELVKAGAHKGWVVKQP